MPYLGFAVTGLAAFLGMMVIAEHDSTSRLVWLRRVLIALGVVGLFWLLMARVLLLRMPAGLYF